MKVFKIFSVLLLSLSMPIAVHAASYTVVDDDLVSDGEIYKYLSTSINGVFEDSSGFVAKAALFDKLTNDPEDALNVFNAVTGSSYSFSGSKYDDGTGEFSTLSWLDNTYGTLESEATLSALILKASTYSLVIVFSSPVDTLEWNTLWSPKETNETSHYVLYPSAVPVPAAAFLFAPALLGFIGLRRKVKA